MENKTVLFRIKRFKFYSFYLFILPLIVWWVLLWCKNSSFTTGLSHIWMWWVWQITWLVIIPDRSQNPTPIRFQILWHPPAEWRSRAIRISPLLTARYASFNKPSIDQIRFSCLQVYIHSPYIFLFFSRMNKLIQMDHSLLLVFISVNN